MTNDTEKMMIITVMKIGIISDTHDRTATLLVALDELVAAGAEYFIHCGDWTRAETLEQIVGYATERRIPVAGVLGNRDDHMSLAKTVSENEYLLMPKDREVLDLELGGKQVLIYHGHNKRTLANLIANNRYDVFMTGHTHKPLIEYNEDKIIINPGSTAFSIPRKKEPRSVAIYDTATHSAELLFFNI